MNFWNTWRKKTLNAYSWLQTKDELYCLMRTHEIDLPPKTVTIKGNPVKCQNPESDITNATIKDAQIGLPDETVVETLSRFGRIVPQSMRWGKKRWTIILTGARYVQIIDVETQYLQKLKQVVFKLESSATTARLSASTVVAPLIPATDVLWSEDKQRDASGATAPATRWTSARMRWYVTTADNQGTDSQIATQIKIWNYMVTTATR